eukprot:gene6034-6735_t
MASNYNKNVFILERNSSEVNFLERWRRRRQDGFPPKVLLAYTSILKQNIEYRNKGKSFKLRNAKRPNNDNIKQDIRKYNIPEHKTKNMNHFNVILLSTAFLVYTFAHAQSSTPASTTIITTTTAGIPSKTTSRSNLMTMEYAQNQTSPRQINVTKKLHYTKISKSYQDVIKNYDKKFRPNYGEKPVAVDIDCHVLTFGDINEVEMEYSLDIYFLQLWFDPRFNLSEPKYKGATVELIGTQVQDVWLPDTIFVNSKKSKFHAITIDNRFLTIYLHSGMMVYHSRITMTAACRMNLRKYPFDVQSCSLAIESYGHDENDVKYKWRKTPGCESNCYSVYIYDREMANFDIIKAEKSKDKTTYHAETFSSATTKFVFKRRQEYFVFRVFIPSILIVMVSWSTFWISQDAVPARAGIIITTILTLITMLGVVNTNMPKVSYIKAIDLFLLVSFIFVFCALVEYIMVLNLHNYCATKKKAKKDTSKRSESDLSHIVKESGSCIVTVKSEELSPDAESTTYFGLQHNGCSFRQRCKDLSSNNETSNALLSEKAQMEIEKLSFGAAPGGCGERKKPSPRPPTHIVDKVARVLFPLVYVVFNFAYWWSAMNNLRPTTA